MVPVVLWVPVVAASGGVQPGTRLTRRRGLAWFAAAGPMLAGVLPALLQGCKSPPPPAPPPPLVGRIVAAAGINPSVSQRPSPLRLRVYELKSTTAFLHADFMALYQGDQAALGADMLTREEFVLQPGESRSFSKALSAQTTHVGVIGLYRDLERATWRATVPVQLGKSRSLLINAEALAVSARVQ